MMHPRGALGDEAAPPARPGRLTETGQQIRARAPSGGPPGPKRGTRPAKTTTSNAKRSMAGQCTARDVPAHRHRATQECTPVGRPHDPRGPSCARPRHQHRRKPASDAISATHTPPQLTCSRLWV